MVLHFGFFTIRLLPLINQYKLENLVNPYINLPDITSDNIPYTTFNDAVITQNLPSNKSTILTTPNNIIGKSIIVEGPIAPFEGVDAGSMLVTSMTFELLLFMLGMM